MRTSNDLFELINSMNQTEKRYFKVYASKHIIGEKNNYVKLFEVIEKQKEYDEPRIRQKFRNEKFIKQLPVAKNYLYNVILKSLDACHQSITSEIYLKLHQIEILYEKALFEQARKLFRETRKKCQKYENYFLELIILKWEKRLLYETNQDKINNYFREYTTIINKINNSIKYEKLHSKLTLINRKYPIPIIRKLGEIREYEKIMRNPYLKFENKALTFEAKVHFNIISTIYYGKRGDFNSSYNYSKKLVVLFQTHKDRIKTDTNIYITALNNHLSCLYYLRRYDEFHETIKSFKMIPHILKGKIDDNTKVHIFTRSYRHELSMYLETVQFENGFKIAKEIEEGLMLYDKKIDIFQKIVFYSSLSYLYFGLGNFGRSLEWLNKFLKECPADAAEDIHCLMRLLYLIVHYELGNLELLEYILKSTYRFMHNRKRIYKYEGIVLNYIKKIFRVNSEDNLITVFKDLKDELENLIKNDEYERKALQLFDLISWLESKIEKKSFIDILKQKYINS